MCASPLSPRHAQPDWMGGGLVSRQIMHDALRSAAIPVPGLVANSKKNLHPKNAENSRRLAPYRIRFGHSAHNGLNCSRIVPCASHVPRAADEAAPVKTDVALSILIDRHQGRIH